MAKNNWTEKAPIMYEDWTRITSETITLLCAGGKPIDVSELAANIVSRIFDEYGGQQLYVPYRFVRSSKMATEIFSDWGSATPTELAKRHKINVHKVYKLYRVGRRLYSQAAQADLFGSQP